MLIGLLNVLVVLCSLILILLVLIQRGKGGGLAGAFGGAGGSSAFGTKAGDIFTKVTMYVAGTWMILLMILVIRVNSGPTSAWGESQGVQAVPAKGAGTTSTKKPSLDTAPPGTAPIETRSTPPEPLNPGDPTPILPPPIPPEETPKP